MNELPIFTMTLTESERFMILEIRARNEKTKARQERTAFILNVALRYYEWLRTSGNGTSFSTFIDDFGAGESTNLHGVSLRDLYDVVMACISATVDTD